jgi:acetyltransferase-like isoleucine patch superfamily enzyme
MDAGEVQPELHGWVELAPDLKVGVGCVIGGTSPTEIATGCSLGNYTTVDGGVHIAENCSVGGYSVLGHPSKREVMGHDATAELDRIQDRLVQEATLVMGPNSVVRSHSVVYLHVRTGPRLVTGHNVMIREHTTIGARCIFGSYASSDGYTVIGDDVQVGQYAQLSQGARIGNGCFVGGHTVFSDNRMAVRDPDLDLFGATLGDRVRIGLACVILPGVNIGDDSMVGAGSVVTGDIPPGVLAVGSPARVLRELSSEEIGSYRDSVAG